jgi:hypothetical protein
LGSSSTPPSLPRATNIPAVPLTANVLYAGTASDQATVASGGVSGRVFCAQLLFSIFHPCR